MSPREPEALNSWRAYAFLQAPDDGPACWGLFADHVRLTVKLYCIPVSTFVTDIHLTEG